MNISRIYTRDAIAIAQSASLQEAADLMRKEHVGCLLVTEDPPADKHAIGIVTDRDLVVQGMAAGLDPERTMVGEVMTPDIARISDTADAHTALEKMAALGIRRLAVSREDGSISGIVSFDDVVDGLAVELNDLARIIRQERRRESAACAMA